jgi:hypothetical protein
MLRLKRSPVPALLLAITTTVAIACGDKGAADPVVVTTTSPLAGLQRGQTNDSAPGAPSTPPATSSGAIHGTVRGPAAPGSGPDTMVTAPRIANVKVTAYTIASNTGGEVAPGDQVATTTTNASGEFQLPTLPGGNYVVTFIPPAESKYRGQYTSGPVNSQTDRYPWYIVLSLK